MENKNTDPLTGKLRECLNAVSLPVYKELALFVYCSNEQKKWEKLSGMKEEDYKVEIASFSTKEKIPDSRKGKRDEKKYLRWNICGTDKLSAIEPLQSSLLKSFLEYLLETISNECIDCLMFENLSCEAGDLKTVCNYLFPQMEEVMKHYAKRLLKQYNMPGLDVIIQLSAQKYEQRPVHGQIIFMNSNDWEDWLKHNTREKVLDLSGIEKEQLGFSLDSIRNLRKLLEMTTDETSLVSVYDSECSLQALVLSENFQLKNAIGFDGHLKWNIKHEGITQLRYKEGKYSLGINLEMDYKEELEKVPHANISDITEIIELLKEEKHGTAVVFASNAYHEAERLGKMNRCIPLIQKSDGIPLLGYLQAMKGITAIDGALLADLKGNCFAIGAILDGKTMRPGKVSRGARFNSVSNYVCIHKGNADIVGVIVSEDGDVTVISD